jgi:hypothetical protein
VLENILRWFAGIVASSDKPTDQFSRLGHLPSVIPTEIRAKCAAATAEAVSTRCVVVPDPTTTALYAAPTTADSKLSQDALANGVANPPNNQQVQRRRDLVRTLFNDFWSASDNKPASFADRLDQAEVYLNERLTACGESWTLDAKTRAMLGLPPRSKSQDEANLASDP